MKYYEALKLVEDQFGEELLEQAMDMVYDAEKEDLEVDDTVDPEIEPIEIDQDITSDLDALVQDRLAYEVNMTYRYLLEQKAEDLGML